MVCKRGVCVWVGLDGEELELGRVSAIVGDGVCRGKMSGWTWGEANGS